MSASAEAIQMANVAARAAASKLAQDIVVIDVSEQLVITDCFVIASAANERQVNAIVDEVEEKMRPLAFFNSKEGRAWAGQWKPSGDPLQNVSVRSFQNGQVVETISSSKASYLDQEWWFFDGSIQRYDSKGRARGSEEVFSKRRFPFGEKPGDFLSSQKDSLSMNYKELSQNMAFYPPDSDIYGRKLVDLHYKIALPFVAITIVLLAVPLAMRTSHGGAAGSAGMSIALAISYYAFLMISLAMGRGGHLPAWLASWLPNILFSTVGAVLIHRNR